MSEGPSFPPEMLASAPDSALNVLLADTDWSASGLGPVATWSAELRTAVGICLNSPFPMLIMWGADLAMIYNDAFVPILGAKHPALGQSCAVVWADAWPVVGVMIDNVMACGESSYHENLPLVVDRHGFDETVYFTFAYSAIPTAAREVGGVFTVVTETTAQVLGTRRLQVLRELGEVRSVQVVDVETACAAAIDVLGRYREDVPFAAAYLVDPERDSAHAVASFGAQSPEGHLIPDRLIPDRIGPEGEGAWIWRAATGAAAQSNSAGSAVTAVALPLAIDADHPTGVLLAGVSAHLMFDDAYRGFLELAADHLGSAITDAHAQAAQLRRAEELAELDRAKTTFFTSVSHELRTPLTLITGPAQDALADRDAPLAAVQRARVEIIRRNAGRLRRMVDTLLDFSRLEDGHLAFEPVAVELGGLTRGIAESFAPAVRRAGLGFTVDCPEQLRAVMVDPGHWERIVLNLLSNAVKFTLTGEIGIGVRLRDDQVVLEVRDTGVGIEAEELPHIFERFRQVRGAAGRSHEGSGIGLALVRELAALHDGDAEVVSHPGRGTTFTVRFPARHTDDPAVRAPTHSVVADYVAEALQWSASAEGADSESAPATADVVLIAEDNADLRTYLSGLLRPEYTVVIAVDGHDALRRARSSRPDLVLADVMMPGLDGLALLRELRADPGTAHTPVIFLSARAGEEAAAEGLAAGADDYLTKPFSSADLLARVRSNLDQARLRNHESAWRTALVNAMQDGFFVASADLSVIEINDAFTRMLGYRAPRLPWPVPHPWWPTAEQDPEGFALVTAALEVVENEGRGRFVLPLRHRNGHKLWVDVSLDSLRDDRSGAVLLVGTLRDVTDRHLSAERDAAVARMAGLLAGIDIGAQVLKIGLAELRECWQAERVSLLTFEQPGVVTVTASSPPHPSSTTAPASAVEYVRTGNLCVLSEAGTLTDFADAPALAVAVGAPVDDGGDRGLLWVEFARPRPFTDADRGLMVQLTSHLQRALTRARANDEQRTIALALQRALLGPNDLPDGFAARYEPAGTALEIGGDWYDVIELPGERYGVVVGDVVGHGLPAATAMGQLRSAARALLLENHGPAKVLSALDRFVEHLPGAYCATVFCAKIDPHARTVTYSSAGHLPALLAEPGKPVRRLDQALSLPMAVRAGRERPEATSTIPDAATLLLYTDGLVERRDEDLDTGIARAASALTAAAHLSPAQTVDEISRRLFVEDHHDDIALLAYRRP
ncbi:MULTISPECIES: SpoIIE family protein phosphatase [Nocardia]|uniref:SpoIIE family protein phosphatase n=1 Tax=Nocardia TaxID=1817 RepID=UPI001E6106E4|nr:MULTISPECIES: SpoIIE family protein phosphatase [Nocardia]